MLSKMILKIRRRETPFTQKVYSILKKIRGSSVPPIRFIYSPLYHGIKLTKAVYQQLKSMLILTPAFKTRLNSYGANLRVCYNMPFVPDSHLIINVGHDVTFLGKNDFSGGKLIDNPTISIGSRINLGFGLSISCYKSVMIEDDCKIASGVFISDNNGHPTDPSRRLEPLELSDVKPILIKKGAWLCTNSMVLKGTIIGENSILAANAVACDVTIPPNCIAYGNPLQIRELKCSKVFPE